MRKKHRALHGLSRALIANMVNGVTKGFEKTLEIVGVGYKAQKTGQQDRSFHGLFPSGGDRRSPMASRLMCPPRRRSS